MAKRNYRVGSGKRLSQLVVEYLRTHEQMTLKEIGHKMDVSESYICLVSNGKRNLTLEHLALIEQFLSVPLPMIMANVISPESAPRNLRKLYQASLEIMNELGS